MRSNLASDVMGSAFRTMGATLAAAGACDDHVARLAASLAFGCCGGEVRDEGRMREPLGARELAVKWKAGGGK